MASLIRVNPLYETLVRRHGLDRFEQVMNWPAGEWIGSNTSRDVARIELDDDGRPLGLYLKREWRTYLKDRMWGCFDGTGWATKARREWRALEALSQAAVGCPEWLVMGEQGRLEPRGYLILAEVRGALDLISHLRRHGRAMSTHERCQLAAHLGHEVARMHEAGVDHPDLFSKHILLSAAPGEPLPRVSFIDLQRSSVTRVVSVRKRLRDLAALDATLPGHLAAATDRLTFLDSYLSCVTLAIDRRDAIAAIRRRRLHLSHRRKIRAMLSDSPAQPEAVVRLEQ